MKAFFMRALIGILVFAWASMAHADEIVFLLKGTVKTDPDPAALGDVYGWDNQSFVMKIKIDEEKSPYREIVYDWTLPYDVAVPASYKQASDYYADTVEITVGTLDLGSYLGQTTVSLAHFIRPEEEDHLQLTVNGPAFKPDSANDLDWYFRTRFKYESGAFGDVEVLPIPIPGDISSDSSFYFDGFVPRGDILVPTANESIYELEITSMSSTTHETPEDPGDDEPEEGIEDGDILYILRGTVKTDPDPEALGDVYGWNNQPFSMKIAIDPDKLPYRVVDYDETLPYDLAVPESYKQAADYYADIVELTVGTYDLSSYLGQTAISLAHFIRPNLEDHIQLTLNGPAFNPNNADDLVWYFRARFKFASGTIGDLEVIPVPLPDDISSESSTYLDGFVPRGDINVPNTNESIYDLEIASMSTIVAELPVANAGEDQRVTEGESVTLDSTGSDSGAGITYYWEQTAGTYATLNGVYTETATFVAPDVGDSAETLTFQLTITDSNGLSASDETNVTVDPASTGDGGGGGCFIDTLFEDEHNH